MPAGTYNTTMEAGATFYRKLTWKDANKVPVPLNGWTAKMQVRASAATPDPPLLSLTVGAGITLVSPGVIEIKATAAQTALVPPGTYRYDLVLYGPGGDPTERLLEGALKVKPQVTK